METKNLTIMQAPWHSHSEDMRRRAAQSHVISLCDGSSLVKGDDGRWSMIDGPMKEGSSALAEIEAEVKRA